MPKVLQLKITLQETRKPPIWRIVQVPATINFQQLHAIIQAAMGWTNSHLHQFFLDRRGHIYIGIPYPDDYDSEIKDGRKIKIKQYLAKEKDKMYYEYDFGDSWEHIIEVQEVLEAEAGVNYPHLLKAKGACPPEDSGGIWGYYDMVEAINDPKHERHEDLLEWTGLEHWDVNEFDVEKHRSFVLDAFENAAISYG